MGVIAAGYEMVAAGKLNCKLQGVDIEVNRVIIKFFKILAWRLRDIFSTLFKGLVSTIKTFGQAPAL